MNIDINMEPGKELTEFVCSRRAETTVAES